MPTNLRLIVEDRRSLNARIEVGRQDRRDRALVEDRRKGDVPARGRNVGMGHLHQRADHPGDVAAALSLPDDDDPQPGAHPQSLKDAMESVLTEDKVILEAIQFCTIATARICRR
jgi:hypothetical protein